MKPISTAFVTIFVLCLTAIASPCRAQASTVPSECTPPSTDTTTVITTTLTATPKDGDLNLASTASTASSDLKWFYTSGSKLPANPPALPNVLDKNQTNMIVVPAGKVALIALEIQGSTPPSQIYFNEQRDLGPEFASITSSFYAKVEEMTVTICDDNSESSEDHTWNFGLVIGGTSYDPQIENKGGGSGG